MLRKLAEGYNVAFPVLLQWAGYLEDEPLSLTPNQAAALSTIGDPSTDELEALRGIMEVLRKNQTATSAAGGPGGDRLAALEPEAKHEIAGYARALLLEADGLGKRPTPLHDLEQAAELVRAGELELDPRDKAELKARFGRWFELSWNRLRGALDFRANTIWIKPNLHPMRERFVISHEIGHAILPAHQEFFAYVDDESSLSASVRAPFEQEANFAAAQLLFQCGQLGEEVDSSPISIELICDCARLFGASIVATAREAAEQSRKDIAIAIAFQPKQMLGPTNVFTSKSFEERYRWSDGLTPWGPLRERLTSARQLVDRTELPWMDARGRQTLLRVESLHTSWAAIVLIVREPALRRNARRLLSGIGS